MWKKICIIILYEIIACRSSEDQLYFKDDINTLTEFMNLREKIINDEFNLMDGSQMSLSYKEKMVNKILMHHKLKVLDDGFVNPGYFNASHHFFEYKDKVKESPVYKILRAMPKGSLLHAHDMALAGKKFLLNLTYEPLLYVCNEDIPKFIYSSMVPMIECHSQWVLMEHARSMSGNVEKFDENLQEYFTIETDNPREVYTDENKVWDKVEQVLYIIKPLLTYKPNWEKYIEKVLYDLYYDNILYVEFRTEVFELYDSLDRHYDWTETVKIYKDVIDRFCNKYNDFYGGRLIYAPQKRNISMNGNIKSELDKVKMLKRLFPDFIAGFDLVGQEDPAPPLKYFLNELYHERPYLDYYFHAGETNWFGTQSDENLVDAVLLGAKRIGNPYALVKHPLLMEYVKQRQIVLEVNVISNQVLHLVDDVRNDPLAILLAYGFNVVLSSDYNWLWGADSLTHDFYVAFIGVAHRRSDLRLLKQLALNSIYCNPSEDHKGMRQIFDQNWNAFLNRIITEYFKDNFMNIIG